MGADSPLQTGIGMVTSPFLAELNLTLLPISHTLGSESQSLREPLLVYEIFW